MNYKGKFHSMLTPAVFGEIELRTFPNKGGNSRQCSLKYFGQYKNGIEIIFAFESEEEGTMETILPTGQKLSFRGMKCENTITGSYISNNPTDAGTFTLEAIL